MKRIALALFLAALVSQGCAADPSPQPTADPAVYGQYPTEYLTIVKDWLSDQLIDPSSAVIEFTSQPKPADLPSGDGKRVYGYLVEFRVNSRNRFGGYTGFQKHGALIRNGQVVRGTGFGY